MTKAEAVTEIIKIMEQVNDTDKRSIVMTIWTMYNFDPDDDDGEPILQLVGSKK